MKDFGLLLVDKPVGPTSHHIVHRVRLGSGVRKVGHAGTLDPRASGLLVLCLGPATRLSEYLSTNSKRYEAVVRFGASTRTYDSDGEVVSRSSDIPTREQIEAVLPSFTGEILQAPPPFSALKVSGERAYVLARAGKDVDLEPRLITIYALRLQDYQPPDLALEVESSAGTYIRSLAHDLGSRLGCGGYLAALRRTKAGPFSLEQAVSTEQLERAFQGGTWRDHLRPASEALPGFEHVSLTPEQVDRVKRGHRIPAGEGSSGMACGLDPDGDLVAILQAVEGQGEWQPHKVFLE